MPITIHHVCGHDSKVDKVRCGGKIPKGFGLLDVNKPCPKCQRKKKGNWGAQSATNVKRRYTTSKIKAKRAKVAEYKGLKPKRRK